MNRCYDNHDSCPLILLDETSLLVHIVDVRFPALTEAMGGVSPFSVCYYLDINQFASLFKLMLDIAL